jgi:hypothetical protein
VPALTPETISLLGGLILAFFTLYFNQRQKSQEIAQSSDAQFFNTLDWLSGRTQRRNLGIAAATKFWARPDSRALLIPPLCSSAIYLLQDSSQCSKLESRNLERIMELLLTVETPAETYRPDYERLLQAITGARGQVQHNHDRCEAKRLGDAKRKRGDSDEDEAGGRDETGLPIDAKELDDWQAAVGKLLTGCPASTRHLARQLL